MIVSKFEDAAAAEGAQADVSSLAARIGKRAVQAVYFAFVLSIPIETINTIKTDADSGFAISRALGIILFGLALIQWRSCFRKLPVAFWMIAWYLAVHALSQLWIPSGLDPWFWGNQMTLIQMAALFLISVNLFSDPTFRGAILRLYGWWVSLVALGMLAGVFGGQTLGSEGRSTILGQDPNVAAGFFALGAVCIAGDPWIYASKWVHARLLLALLGISALITAILQTGSRGGLLVFVSGIVGLTICGGKATRLKRFLIAGAVVGVLGGLVLREFKQGTLTASRLEGAWARGDTAGRAKVYGMAWSLFKEKPLLGYGGVNNFAVLGASLNDVFGHVYVKDTHNLLLALLTEVGLVGALPFIGAMFYALWIAWRYGRRMDDALPFALMCEQFLINASLTGLHQKLFWIVFAAAVACGLQLSADREEKPI